MVFLFNGFDPDLGQRLARWAALVGGRRRVALLLQGGEGWEAWVPAYCDLLAAVGLTEVALVAPGAQGPTAADLAVVGAADGLWIGGGQTEVYRRHYGSGALGDLVAARARSGLPVAGLSAGALVLTGLGLAGTLEVVPHGDEEGAEERAEAARGAGREVVVLRPGVHVEVEPGDGWRLVGSVANPAVGKS